MKVYCIGDIHSDIDRFKLLLVKYGICDTSYNWIIDDSVFVSIGDLTDRGEHGIEVIKLIQKLEAQAEQAGGKFVTLCGNHDAMMIAQALQIKGLYKNRDLDHIFYYNGGLEHEAETISKDDSMLDWLQNLPLMFKFGNLLFQHADTANYYLSMGTDVTTINQAGREMMQTGSGAWQVFCDMCDCRFFDTSYMDKDHAESHINSYMSVFGVNTIVHGHTRFVGNKPSVYFGGHIINVDGSLSNGYRSDPNRGFVVSWDNWSTAKEGHWILDNLETELSGS